MTSPPELPDLSLDALRARWRGIVADVSTDLRRHRAMLWPAIPLFLVCLLSAPLLETWIRWVELPEVGDTHRAQTCPANTPLPDPATTTEKTDPLGEKPQTPGTDAAAAADTASTTIQAEHAAALAAATLSLDRQQARYAPQTCISMQRIEGGPLLRSLLYRFDDGSLLTQHLRAAAPGRPGLAPVFASNCPVKNRQSVMIMVGLLLVGAVVVLHRTRSGGRFFDFRNVIREPLQAGEKLLLFYSFVLILGTMIGAQFGSCAASQLSTNALSTNALSTSALPTSVPVGGHERHPAQRMLPISMPPISMLPTSALSISALSISMLPTDR